MDELEEIKKRRLAELQAKQQDQLQKQLEEQQKVEDQLEQLEAVVKQFLTRDALERYGNVKIAHTEKAIRLLAILGQMIQSGKIRDQITDEQLKLILMRLEPPKKDFKIKKV